MSRNPIILDGQIAADCVAGPVAASGKRRGKKTPPPFRIDSAGVPGDVAPPWIRTLQSARNPGSRPSFLAEVHEPS